MWRQKKRRPSVSRVLFPVAKNRRMPAIYPELLSPTVSIVLPSNLGKGTPSSVGLHELSTSGVHSTAVTRRPGGLLPHLLTLTLREKHGFARGAVLFFCTHRPLRISSILGSGLPMCCPDFPLAIHRLTGETASGKLSGSAFHNANIHYFHGKNIILACFHFYPLKKYSIFWKENMYIFVAK